MILNQIDWNEQWKEQMIKCMQSRKIPEGTGFSRYWNTPEMARNYLKYSDFNSDNNGQKAAILEKIHIAKGDRVLEIGPGPGIFTIPMAKIASHIPAIEPSPAMASVLHEQALSKGITNISIIEKRWEDIDIDELGTDFDLVFASFSLGMVDIKEAIKKMTSVCKGKVIILHHVDGSPFDTLYKMVWPSLYNKEYITGPKSDILFNVLYTIGIYPSVEYFERSQNHVFSSFQELYDFFKIQHFLEFDMKNEGIQKYMSQYIEEKNGVYYHRELYPGMMFQWNRNNLA